MPANTGVDLPVSAICRLAKHKNIIGLKDSSGNVVKMATVRRRRLGYVSAVIDSYRDR